MAHTASSGSESAAQVNATAWPLQISSDFTAVYKYLFPAAFVVATLVSLVGAVHDPRLLSIGGPSAFASVFLVSLGRRLKSVSLTDSALRVSGLRRTLLVPLEDVATVRFSRWIAPPLATITLRTPTRFGRAITLIPRGAGLLVEGRPLQQLRDRLGEHAKTHANSS